MHIDGTNASGTDGHGMEGNDSRGEQARGGGGGCCSRTMLMPPSPPGPCRLGYRGAENLESANFGTTKLYQSSPWGFRTEGIYEGVVVVTMFHRG